MNGFDRRTSLGPPGKCLSYLDDVVEKDLVALRPVKDEDQLSQFLKDSYSIAVF